MEDASVRGECRLCDGRVITDRLVDRSRVVFSRGLWERVGLSEGWFACMGAAVPMTSERFRFPSIGI